MTLRVILTTAAVLALAACGDNAAPPADDEASATTSAPPPPSASPAAVSREDVEFAAECQALLNAANARQTVSPTEALPQVPAGLAIWWTGEMARRADAAGLTEDELRELLTRRATALSSDEAVAEAAPRVQACIDQGRPAR